MAEENIEIRGARVNNLKNLSLDIPRGKFVVVTGISGSGKSSLVFDTLYAEGQRRFSESLSSYARQFLGRMTKPDVDSIDGIPPAIAIEQKVTTRNPRSTVATTTEIYDYLRLVFARAGHTFSPVSGREVHKDTVDTVMAYLERTHETCYVLADLKWAKRDDKVELMLGLKEDGFNRLYADGGPVRIDDVLQKDGNYPDEAWLLVDRVRLPENGEMDADTRTRLLSSVATAFSKGDGDIAVASEDGAMRHFCSRFELDGIVFREPDEYLFSFNSPLGACPVCGGLGKIIGVSEDLVIPDKTKSIYDGAIACWRGEKMGWFKDHLIKVAERYGIPVFEPWCNLSAEVKKIIWEGHSVEGDENSIVGIKEFFDWVETQRYKIQFKYMLSRFSGRTECRACGGSRLRKEALWVRVDGKNINGGFLVGVGPEDFSAFGSDPLAGVRFQEQWEHAAFQLGGGNFYAPAQRVEDFLLKQPSQGPGSIRPTYRPGVTWTELDRCLPQAVADTLRGALPLMDRKLRGFACPDGVLTGVETRSSSPVRILRDETLQSALRGLYPCGEGAGYAGGIVSAAVDGIRVAEAIAKG